MIKKYALLLVMGLMFSGCYTEFAVIHDQPMQMPTQITYQIDSITGDTIKVVHQIDTITKTKNCYWIRNFWGQPEYHCDGDGYNSVGAYYSNGYNSSWYDYNENPWWYRSYSYSDGAFWGYPRSYYGHDRDWYGGGGGGSYSPSSQSTAAPRASRSYGIPSSSSINSVPSSSYSPSTSGSVNTDNNSGFGISGSNNYSPAPSSSYGSSGGSGSSNSSSGSRRSSSFGIPNQSNINSIPNQEKKK
jgi:hypothetical protein